MAVKAKKSNQKSTRVRKKSRVKVKRIARKKRLTKNHHRRAKKD
jgi:hypothetical protein